MYRTQFRNYDASAPYGHFTWTKPHFIFFQAPHTQIASQGGGAGERGKAIYFLPFCTNFRAAKRNMKVGYISSLKIIQG